MQRKAEIRKTGLFTNPEENHQKIDNDFLNENDFIFVKSLIFTILFDFSIYRIELKRKNFWISLLNHM